MQKDQYSIRLWTGEEQVTLPPEATGRDTESILAAVCRILGTRYIDWRFTAHSPRTGRLQILMQEGTQIPYWLPVYAMHRTEGTWTVFLSEQEEEE